VAVELYQQVVELYGTLRDMDRMAKVYGELGSAYREMGRLELSTRYSQKSIAIHEMLRDHFSTAMAENNLALALMNMSDYSAAEQHLERSVSLLDQIGRSRGKSHVLLSLSELYLNRGDLDKAEEFGLGGLELAHKMGERATEAEAHQWLGRAAAEREDAETTDREFQAAIGMLEKLNLSERLMRAHALYAEILEDRGDMEAANRHLKKVLAASRPDLVAHRRERAEHAALA
jgi:tetratricopeptide (TPR) repeat protein